MAFCINCGSYIPDDQGSRSCSMCYGDVGHGKDGYYREHLERQEQQRKMLDERFTNRKLPPIDHADIGVPYLDEKE